MLEVRAARKGMLRRRVRTLPPDRADSIRIHACQCGRESTEMTFTQECLTESHGARSFRRARVTECVFFPPIGAPGFTVGISRGLKTLFKRALRPPNSLQVWLLYMATVTGEGTWPTFIDEHTSMMMMMFIGTETLVTQLVHEISRMQAC